MRCSIGGYHLKGMREWEGRHSTAFEVRLYHYELELAVVEDRGDGIVQVLFNKGVLREQRNKIMADMQKILKALRANGVLEQGALAEQFGLSPVQASEGFTYLLMDLINLAKEATRIERAIPDPERYRIIKSLGGSWFVNEGYPEDVRIELDAPLIDPEVTAEEIRRSLLNRYTSPTTGRPVIRALAVYKGNMDWNLSLRDYIDLYTP